MEKIYVPGRSDELKAMMAQLQYCYCEVWQDGYDIYIKFPNIYDVGMLDRHFKRPESTSLRVRASELADTICDPDTKSAFNKFVDYVIETLEKK